MAVHLGNTRLWQPDDDRLEQEGDVRVDSIYGSSSEDTLLTGLTRTGEFTYTGVATGNRLSQQSKFDNDPLVALAEWVAEMETFVNGNQGDGWILEDDERSESFENIVLRSFGWQREAGDKYQVRWDIDGVWADGLMPTLHTPPDPVDPGTSTSPKTTATLDGNDLGAIQSWRQQKTQEIKVYPIATADPGQNQVKANTGATRQILLQGNLIDDPSTSANDMNQFDSNIEALIGEDITVQYKSAFPGRTKTVMVNSYDSVRESGLTRLGEYSLEMFEGVA